METVKIPGGEAVMLNKRNELTAGRRRPIELLSARIGKKVTELSIATRIICDGEVAVDNTDRVDPETKEPLYRGGDVEVTEKQLELMMRLNDATAASLLVSWTLDRPLPRNEDEIRDLEVGLYDVLIRHAARINAGLQEAGDEFTPDGGMEDLGSPTGG